MNNYVLDNNVYGIGVREYESPEKFIWVNFSQNQKGFGCISAAVLLILSPKELILQKTRQSSLAITATVSAISQPL